MSNGRNHKTRPTNGFESAALALTMGLSDEATRNLTMMVKDVAEQYSYDDSLMLRRLMSRIRVAARSRKAAWAKEVLARLEGATA